MTLLKRLFGELFNSEQLNEEEEEELILQERIEPTDFFLREYEEWLKADLHRGLLEHLRDQQAQRRADPTADLTFFEHRADSSSGFYFIGEDPWSNKDYAFIIHYFGQLIEEEGYRLNNTKREVKQKDGRLNTEERYYYKLPLSSRKQQPYEQAWGNLLIEQKIRDERTQYVKVMAHSYSDRSYQPAREFESLEKKLLTP